MSALRVYEVRTHGIAVADAVEWPDGRVVVHWRGGNRASQVWTSMALAIAAQVDTAFQLVTMVTPTTVTTVLDEP